MTCVNTSSIMNHKTGQIQVIFGPMFSGKTTELMRRMKRYLLANYKCLVIKYAKDTRYDANNIATHDKQTLEAKATTVLDALTSEALKCDVIGIDEGQFFPDVVEFSEKMADMGKTVIVAALDGDFQRKGFGSILNLVPLAESVIKLTAVCMVCYGEGSFTKRKGHETQLEVIGGTEMYLAACRACYKPATQTSPLCSPLRHKQAENLKPRGDQRSIERNLFKTGPVKGAAAPLGDRTNFSADEMETAS